MNVWDKFETLIIEAAPYCSVLFSGGKIQDIRIVGGSEHSGQAVSCPHQYTPH
ncbi:hypothetical protein D3C87_2191350 [compost metagenome]